MNLEAMRREVHSFPRQLAGCVFPGAPVEGVFEELFRFMLERTLIDDLDEDPYPYIHVLLEAALYDRWDSYAALEARHRTYALDSAGWNLWPVQVPPVAEPMSQGCSAPSLVWSVIVRCSDDFSIDIGGANRADVYLLRHVLYGDMGVEVAAEMDSFVNRLLYVGHPVDVLPTLLIRWALDRRLGHAMDLREFVDRRRALFPDLSGWHYSDPESNELYFIEYLEVYAPQYRPALAARLADVWRLLSGESSEGSDSEQQGGLP